MAKIPITLEAGTADGRLANAQNIYDSEIEQFQSSINEEYKLTKQQVEDTLPIIERLNDVKDTLNSTDSDKPLSANQGKILKELLDAKVIETDAVPMDSEPTEGNTSHIVTSDGIKKELNKKVDNIDFEKNKEKVNEKFFELGIEINTINLSENEVSGYLENVSGGQPIKFLHASFKENTFYDLHIIPTNIVKNGNDDINIVIRNVDDQYHAIAANIKSETHITYHCETPHNVLYISVYNGSCDIKIVAKSVVPILELYAKEGTEFKSDYDAGNIKMFYFNEVDNLNHITFGTDVNDVAKYEGYFTSSQEYATICQSGFAVGVIRVNTGNIYPRAFRNERGMPIKDIFNLKLIEELTSDPNRNAPNNYILGKVISEGLNQQNQTGITVTGAFVLSHIGGIKRISVEIGKKYYIKGYYNTLNTDLAAIGQFSDIAFSNPIGLIVQSSNTMIAYDQVIEAVNNYLYVPDTIDVYPVIENLITMDFALDKNSNNAVANSIITNAIISLNDKIAGTNGKPAVLTIAASNASDYAKANANLTCNGVNDQDIINSAISMLPDDGGEIQLSEGVFNISSPIIIDRLIKIVGEGHSIAGRPSYTPTTDIDYSKSVFGFSGETTSEGSHNLYLRTEGGTILRAEADCNVLQIGKSVNQKLQVILRDFSIQGYGKDRHTKCGIYGKSSTDITQIDNISVTDCYIGCYLHGNANNSYNDALKIVNSSFQWCACGLVVFGYWNNIINCCVADNNGISTYTDEDNNTTILNTGGIYCGGGSGFVLTNNIIVRTSHFVNENIPYDSLVINSPTSIITNNQIYSCSHNGIRAESCNNGIISNNRICGYGRAKLLGQQFGIKIVDTWTTGLQITNNTIGFDSKETKENDGRAINSASKAIIIIKNNLFSFMGNKSSYDEYVQYEKSTLHKGNIACGFDDSYYANEID